MESFSGDELDALAEHLAAKAQKRIEAGETSFSLRVSPDRQRQFGGNIGFALEAKMKEQGVNISIRQWTGEGYSGVVKVLMG